MKELLGHLSDYWLSRALLTAVELDLFTHIDRGSTTDTALAASAGASERGVRAMLTVMKALGLVEDSLDGLLLTDRGRLLSSDNPHHRLGIFWHHINLWVRWNDLTRCVISGESSGDGLELESFILAMAHGKIHSPAEYVGDLPLRGDEKILDLGGGPGTLSLALLEASSDIRVDLYDLPDVIEIARKILPRKPIESGRLTLVAGDYLRDPVGSGYDMVWASSIIHSLARGEAAELMKRAAGSLKRGGRLVVRDFFLDPGADGPLFPALFSLNMLVNTREGRSYTTDEVRSMLEAAGLTRIRLLRSVPPSSMLVGVRP